MRKTYFSSLDEGRTVNIKIASTASISVSALLSASSSAHPSVVLAPVHSEMQSPHVNGFGSLSCSRHVHRRTAVAHRGIHKLIVIQIKIRVV